MMSTPPRSRTRKSPTARRAEILTAAARIGLSAGLENITLRAVANSLDVRPGLIHHYFPSVDDLIVAAFRSAAGAGRFERQAGHGTATERIARFVTNLESREAKDQFRLWFSAREISRSSAAMAMALEELEEMGRASMTQTIEAGIRDREFPDVDATMACVRIYMALDGYGAYVNSPLPFEHIAYRYFVADVAEWALSLPPGTLRAHAEISHTLERP
ncbi:TetR/AcrR family transcriptional regulator [Brevibacterium permense]|nr:TetR/AcrR family transcriptional regulator [Brevibacterium permense]